MSFYIFIAALSFFIAYVADKYNSKLGLIVLILLYTIICGFRGENVGLDTLPYVEMYKVVKADGLIRLELGFSWLIKLSSNISDSPTVMFILSNLIIYILILTTLWNKRAIGSFPIAILILSMSVFPSSMNIMRQYIAIAILFYSSKYLEDSQYLKFIIGVSIASLFHISSVLFLLLLGFELFKWRILSLKRKLFIISIILVGIAGTGAFVTFFSDAYGFYLDYKKETNVGLLVPIKFLCVCVAIPFSGILRRSTDYATRKYKTFVIVVSLLGLCLSSVGYFMPVLNRISLPFTIFEILLWAIFFKHVSKKNKLVLSFMFFIVFVIPFIMSLSADSIQIIPYYMEWM